MLAVRNGAAPVAAKYLDHGPSSEGRELARMSASVNLQPAFDRLTFCQLIRIVSDVRWSTVDGRTTKNPAMRAAGLLYSELQFYSSTRTTRRLRDSMTYRLLLT